MSHLVLVGLLHLFRFTRDQPATPIMYAQKIPNYSIEMHMKPTGTPLSPIRQLLQLACKSTIEEAEVGQIYYSCLNQLSRDISSKCVHNKRPAQRPVSLSM